MDDNVVPFPKQSVRILEVADPDKLVLIEFELEDASHADALCIALVRLAEHNIPGIKINKIVQKTRI